MENMGKIVISKDEAKSIKEAIKVVYERWAEKQSENVISIGFQDVEQSFLEKSEEFKKILKEILQKAIEAGIQFAIFSQKYPELFEGKTVEDFSENLLRVYFKIE
jgi:hypothetical protein